MSASSGPSIQTNDLVFDYDMSNTQKSFKGPPATDRIVSIPLTLTVYAYASGPVSTANIIDATYQLRTVSRYTITNNINTARAMVTSSGLTTGVSYTFSCKIKYNGTNVVTPSFAVDASKGNPEGGVNNNTVSSSVGATTSLGNGWYYVTYTWSYSACPTGGCYLTYGVVTGSDATYLTNTFDVYELQFEIGSFATPYVTQSTGIRSNTQAIVDLTGRNTITANSLTYAADNTFSFNGSSNNLSIGSFSGYSTNITCEAWFKTTSAATWKNIVCGPGGDVIFTVNGALLNFGTQNNSPIPHANYSTTTVNTGAWFHGIATYDGSNVRIYINGNLESTNARTGIITSGAKNIGSNSGGSSEYFNGTIATVKVYNRALSAAEVQQNFNAQRTRYGI